ncbi:hypothetical protein QWJ07_03875 [Frankia sp. RB7]|nr:hypothetical protein [Frankia sp. RB7]
MAKKVVTTLEPGHPDFDALATAKHLSERMGSFPTPMALSCYWNAKKNQERMKLLPEKWRDELWRRYQQNIDTLNNAGPY